MGYKVTSKKLGKNARGLTINVKLSAVAKAVRFSIIGASLIGGVGHAATIEVDSNLDDAVNCTLREAITSVNNGIAEMGCPFDETTDPIGTNDEIVFSNSLTSDTIELTQGIEIPITADVILSAKRNSKITINGGSSSNRIFNIDGSVSGANVTLYSLVLDSGGDADSPDLVGGAIYASSSATLTLDNCDFTNNGAFNGGAVAVVSSTLDLIETTLSLNSVGTLGSGGAIYIIDSPVSLDRTDIFENSSNEGNGAGVFATGASSIIDINFGTFNDNVSELGSGNAIWASEAPITIRNSEFSGNESASDTASGGAIFAEAAALSISTSEFDSNTAGLGGAIYAGGLGSVISIANTTLSNNAGQQGGALNLHTDFNATIDNTMLSENVGASQGGAIYASDTGSILVSKSTFSGNTSPEEGGAVFLTGAVSTTMNTSTLSGNGADTTNGGAIYSNSSSSLTIRNSTLSDNIGASGGAVHLNTSSMVLRSSIIANSSGDDCYSNTSSTNSDTFSIVESDNCMTGAREIDPELIPLGDNGGSTETHALLSTSPAIDTGPTICGASDQRGDLRSDGLCDVGAIEFNPDDRIPVVDVPSDNDGFFVIPLRDGKAVVIP